MPSKCKPWGQSKPKVGWKPDPKFVDDYGLVCAYQLNEAGGLLAFDALDLNTPATFNNSATWNQGGQFNAPDVQMGGGASDFLSVPSTVIGALANVVVSVSLWFYPTGSLTAYQALWDSTSTGGGSGRQISAFLGGAANHLYLAFAGSGGGELTLTDSWVANVWNHVVVTCDGTVSGTIVYRNGVRVGDGTGLTLIGAGFTAVAIQLGNNPSTGGASFTGQQDVFLVGKKVWTADMAWQLYNSPFGFMQAPRRRLWNTAAGGTTFTTSPAGSETASGALTKLVLKGLAGSSTGAGALRKQVVKSAAGSSTTTGGLAKQTQKPLAGGATAIGTLARLCGKVLAGGVTGAGTLVKVVAKAFGGSSTAMGTDSAIKTALLAVAGSLSATGAIRKQTAKPVAGSVTATGLLSKQDQKPLAGSVTAAGAETNIKVALLALAGSLSAGGALTKLAGKKTAGSVTPTGALAKQTTKPFAGSVKPRGGSTGLTDAVAYYALGGDLTDATGNGRTLTGSGAAFGTGKLGQGLTGGTATRTPLGGLSGQLDRTPLSLAFWLNLPGPNVDGFGAQVGWEVVAGHGFGITVFGNSGYEIDLYFASLIFTLFNPGTLSAGWHHFAFVLPGDGDVKAYVDGALVHSKGTGDWFGGAGDLTSLQFQLETTTGGPLANPLDEVIVANRVWTAAEVTQLYAGGVGFNPFVAGIGIRVLKGLAGMVSGVGAFVKKALKSFIGFVTGTGSLATSGGSESAPIKVLPQVKWGITPIGNTTWQASGQPSVPWSCPAVATIPWEDS